MADFNDFRKHWWRVNLYIYASSIFLSARLYGSDITLTALLTSNGTPITGVIVAFYLNGVRVGNATTDSAGIATLTYSVNSSNRIAEGTYNDYIKAYYGGDGYNYGSCYDMGSLTIYGQAPSTGSQTGTQTQTPQQSTGSVAPAN